MSRRHLLSAAVVAVLSSAVYADTIYVDAGNCPGPGSGTPADPYCSIQTAIDNAVDTDEIIVAPGTYFETINFLGKGVWLHSSDGPEVTVIDGTGNFHVVRCMVGAGMILDGFTVTGGNANGGAWPNDIGGGMLIHSGSPTVTNCTFSGNTASSGGGMSISTHSLATVTNCTFSGNSAEGEYAKGGGMRIGDASPTVTDCVFSGNSARWGGGVYTGIDIDSAPTITNCTFSGNSAEYGGGMKHGASIEMTVASCTFSENTADYAGGGFWTDEWSADVYLTDFTFCGNVPSHLSGPVTLSGHTRMNDFCPIPVCPGDTDGDGTVGIIDFLALLGAWGECPP
jgi:hypothetical protein